MLAVQFVQFVLVVQFVLAGAFVLVVQFVPVVQFVLDVQLVPVRKFVLFVQFVPVVLEVYVVVYQRAPDHRLAWGLWHCGLVARLCPTLICF